MKYEITYRQDNLYRIIVEADTIEQAETIALESEDRCRLLDSGLEIIDIREEN